VTRRSEPTRDLELRQLRAIVALIDHGSITEAARSLKLAQSTVSEALAAGAGFNFTDRHGPVTDRRGLDRVRNPATAFWFRGERQ
jgi:hypothetical protein